MQFAGSLIVIVLGLALVAATAVAVLPSTNRWIRVADFPRAQIAVLLVVTMAATFWLLPLGLLTGAFLALQAAALGWQLWRIWPYTPLHSRQVLKSEACRDGARFTLMVANVLMSNRKSEALLARVREIDPDLVLLVETDAWWDRALAPLLDRYPHAIRHPQDNTYGMHLFSRLPLEAPRLRHLLTDEIPSIKTGVRLRSGQSIVLYGVHPRPPPRADTAQRDAELVLVGREVRRGDEPAVVAGDLNDVAWSKTTTLFQQVSGLLDPRVGRGFFPTFHARWRLLRWPLDHVFFAPVFRLAGLRVLPGIGSDHFPLLVALCHCPSAADDHAEIEAEQADLARMREVIAEGREAAHEA
ncbi:hypothetical protein A33M_2753 [Rhodovulum sp. PH10]|uniref:endonuclease/exonuclease/phosphatase family protein n=1 Tax=Rhodovulum sp. PH10 TaxID=1187851 RepID=UPI00027C2670|nr:endonuclease/exonuclease/phosphatase family protein [Rhodovulum sp. PH10]EJW11770.1 hypothetical protein A33M_2753 [Rhodovulum sp. PH10]